MNLHSPLAQCGQKMSAMANPVCCLGASHVVIGPLCLGLELKILEKK